MNIWSRIAARPYWPLIPFCLGVFIAADDQTVVVTLLPDLLVDLEIGANELDRASWTITGYLIGFTAAMPFMGRTSDRIGRKFAFIAAMTIFMAGSAFVAVSVDIPIWLGGDDPSLNLTVAARVVQAIGGGAIIPIAIAAVGDLLPAGRHAVAFGIVGATAEAGGVIGPLWGGLLTEFASWEWAFWLNIPFGILAVSLVLRSRADKRRPVRIDWAGAVLFALVLSLLTAGLSRAGDANAWFFALMAGSAISLVLLIVWHLRAPVPLIPRSLVRLRAFAAANTAHFLIGGALIIAMVTVPLMADTVLGKSPLEGGLRLLRLTAAIPVGAIAGGLLTQRYGARWPAIAGLVLAAVGFALMSRWGLDVSDPSMTIHLVITGIGFGLLISPITIAALSPAADDERGAASSLVTMSRMVGMTVGLAAITAWGTTRFDSLVADAPAFSIDPAVQEEISRIAANAGLEVFQTFFLTAAVVCAIALIPVWVMSRRT